MAVTQSSIITLGGTSLLPGGKKVYGSKPKVPGKIDYGQALQDTVRDNLELLPSLTELGTQSTETLNKILEYALPGYGKLRDTTTGILQDKLEGNVPRDVSLRLQRDAAERGITLGTSGSQSNEFDELRNLGLTSLAIQNEGLAQTSSWLAQNRANTFDFTKMFRGPQDSQHEAEFNWNRDWLAAQVKAAPDPVARGELDTEMGIMGMMAGAYAGAAPMQRYQPGYQAGSGTAKYGEQAAMGGGSYLGDSGGATIGYTPTNYQGGIIGSGAANAASGGATGGAWDIGAGAGAQGALAAGLA